MSDEQKKYWTVIAVYEDNNQTYSDYVLAVNEFQAMAMVGHRIPELLIIGAIEGKHPLLTPGEDNLSAAYGSDMADLLPEEG